MSFHTTKNPCLAICQYLPCLMFDYIKVKVKVEDILFLNIINKRKLVFGFFVHIFFWGNNIIIYHCTPNMYKEIQCRILYLPFRLVTGCFNNSNFLYYLLKMNLTLLNIVSYVFSTLFKRVVLLKCKVIFLKKCLSSVYY